MKQNHVIDGWLAQLRLEARQQEQRAVAEAAPGGVREDAPVSEGQR